MQNKVRNLIILLLIIFIIVLATIVVLNIKEQKKFEEKEKEIDEYANFMADPLMMINGKTLNEIKAKSETQTLEGIIKKYNDYLIAENAEAIYSVLYDKYITENNLKKENVLNNLEKYLNYEIIQLVGLNTSNYGIYYAKIDNGGTEKFLMINWDIQNNTFSICPINETTYNEGVNVGIEADQERVSPIEENQYNKVS